MDYRVRLYRIFIFKEKDKVKDSIDRYQVSNHANSKESTMPLILIKMQYLNDLCRSRTEITQV